MRSEARQAPPGVTGTARVGRDAAALLPLLGPGDVAVVDHVDLDRETAAALVEAGVAAVVNAAPVISGRYANLGPELLAEAGVVLVDRVGAEGIARIADDQLVRVHAGAVHAVPTGDEQATGEELARGRAVDLALVHREMEEARGGLVGRLDALTRATHEFVRREPDLLLHGAGLPPLRTELANRPVVVVAAADHAALQSVRGFVRERNPVLVAVGAAADDVLGLSWVPDVVLVTAGDPSTLPSGDALRVATDVVLIARPGSSLAEQATIEAVAAAPPLLVDTAAAPEDVALLLAERSDAALVVGVGLARLEDLLEAAPNQPGPPGPAGPASGFVTRLKLGDRLVDAAAVRTLRTGRTATTQLALVLVVGLVALLAAIAATPVGQGWGESLLDTLGRLR